MNSNNPQPELVTRYLNKRNKTLKKSRESANESSKANRRVKTAYSNTVNTILNNPSITAKKEIWHPFKANEK